MRFDLFPDCFWFFQYRREKYDVKKYKANIEEQVPGKQILFIQFFHRFVINYTLRAHPQDEYTQYDPPVAEKHSHDEKRIKKKLCDRIKGEQEAMNGFIEFRHGIMPGLLFKPVGEIPVRYRQCMCFRVNDNSCILFVGSHVDEEVIVATGNMVMRRETFEPVKQSFFIGQVSSYAHIRNSCKRIRKILKGRMESFEPDQFI
jgi:hypothetical protein